MNFSNRTITWLRTAGLLLSFWRIDAAASHSVTEDALAAHNLYRSRTGVAPLVWSDKLAARAQHWASTLINRGSFAPERDSPFGQNLFEISGGEATPADVVKAWMSEEQNYSYAKNTCHGRCGHYTQVIWRDTKRLGCAMARKDSREVWVCEYDPPGNVVGERPY